MLFDIFLILAGFVTLIFGAELIVRASCKIAEWLGISKALIGLTIVALGTSLPEMIISYIASFQGEPSIAVGNVVGSNIANITLILGSASLLAPMVTDRQILKREIPLMIISAFLVFLFAHSGVITFFEGLVLFILFVLFISFTVWRYKKETKESAHDHVPGEIDVKRNIILGLMGFVLLVFGGDWVVEGGKHLARSFGVSEWLIGVTIVALGTSLPELATSLVAAYKGELDISMGNVIGSNLFNTLVVLGGAAMIGPAVINEQELYRDILIMLFLSILIFPFARTKYRISRWQGAFLLLSYFVFIISLILNPDWRLF